MMTGEDEMALSRLAKKVIHKASPREPRLFVPMINTPHWFNRLFMPPAKRKRADAFAKKHKAAVKQLIIDEYIRTPGRTAIVDVGGSMAAFTIMGELLRRKERNKKK